MTRPPLELLADWLEVQRELDAIDTSSPFDPSQVPTGLVERAERLNAALFALDPAALRAQAEAGHAQLWVMPAVPADPLPEAVEYHQALMTVACQDTTDYDNAVTETVCDRLLEVIAGQGEPSFGGPRLNMIVRLIRDLRAQAEAEREPEPMPADLAPMLRAVIQAGPATWQVTGDMTAEQHGEAFAQSVRNTAGRYRLGDEPRAVHWLSVGDDASLAFVGTSPNSPHLARALGGAWNDLVQVAPELLARCAQAEAGGE